MSHEHEHVNLADVDRMVAEAVEKIKSVSPPITREEMISDFAHIGVFLKLLKLDNAYTTWLQEIEAQRADRN